MRKYLLILVIILSGKTFSQPTKTVKISGTVYISSSRSQGIANGQTFSEPQQLFKHQNIYFNNDTIQVSAKTDSLGIYTIEIKPGTYNVYQEQGLKNSKNGTLIYGSYGLKITIDGNGYDIYFKNIVNGRSAMMNKGMGSPAKPYGPAKKSNK